MSGMFQARRSSVRTQRAAKAFTRRTLLAQTAAALAAVGPFVVSRGALSSSGELTWFT